MSKKSKASIGRGVTQALGILSITAGLALLWIPPFAGVFLIAGVYLTFFPDRVWK